MYLYQVTKELRICLLKLRIRDKKLYEIRTILEILRKIEIATLALHLVYCLDLLLLDLKSWFLALGT